jgi:hypothetical protein
MEQMKKDFEERVRAMADDRQKLDKQNYIKMSQYQDHIERLENNEHEKIRTLKTELVESRTDNENLR